LIEGLGDHKRKKRRTRRSTEKEHLGKGGLINRVFDREGARVRRKMLIGKNQRKV